VIRILVIDPFHLVSDARAAGGRRFAVWRMGQEDGAL
jgi:hypothetical protein